MPALSPAVQWADTGDVVALQELAVFGMHGATSCRLPSGHQQAATQAAVRMEAACGVRLFRQQSACHGRHGPVRYSLANRQHGVCKSADLIGWRPVLVVSTSGRSSVNSFSRECGQGRYTGRPRASAMAWHNSWRPGRRRGLLAGRCIVKQVIIFNGGHVKASYREPMPVCLLHAFWHTGCI